MVRKFQPQPQNITEFIKLISPNQLAAILGVSKFEISRLVKQRALPFFRLGTSTRKRGGQEVVAEHVQFDLRDVDEFLNCLKVKGRGEKK